MKTSKTKKALPTTSLKLETPFSSVPRRRPLTPTKIIFAYTICAYLYIVWWWTTSNTQRTQQQNSLKLHGLIDKCNKWIVSNWALPSVRRYRATHSHFTIEVIDECFGACGLSGGGKACFSLVAHRLQQVARRDNEHIYTKHRPLHDYIYTTLGDWNWFSNRDATEWDSIIASYPFKRTKTCRIFGCIYIRFIFKHQTI